MVEINRLSRNQIAAFVGNDPDAIRAVELLFEQVQTFGRFIQCGWRQPYGGATASTTDFTLIADGGDSTTVHHDCLWGGDSTC